MPQARLIALDWGTSSLRAYLLGEERVGRRACASKPWGLHLPEGGFGAALKGVAGDWLGAMPALPLIASGMVGSAQAGARRLCGCPADAGGAGGATAAFRGLAGRATCTSSRACAWLAPGPT